MKKKLLPIILDTAFVFIATLSACFAVFRFYIDKLWLCALLSSALAALSAAVFRHLSYKKSVKYSLKREDEERKDAVLNSLCLMSETELSEYFCSLLGKMQLPHAAQEDGSIILTESNTAVYFYFTFSKTYAGRVIEFYKQTQKACKTLVIGREFSEEVRALTARFCGRIELLDGTGLYLTMKRFELFPPIKEELKEVKQKLNLPKTVFNKKRARQYFLYGLTLEFFSFFAFYPIYYVLMGTALILFAIVCYFFGIKEVEEFKNPFR